MNKYLKWILIIFFVLTGVVITGYGAYRIYDYLIEDATKRIKKGISEGIGEGVGGAINPLNWLGKKS